MSGINKVILIGNLGKDPEVRHLDGGIAFAKFSLATSEVYKKQDGTRVETTEWHNIVMWRGLAETAERFLRKGSQVYIEGKIKTRSYDDNGVKKYITEIIADGMTFLGRKPEESPAATAPAENAKPTETATASTESNVTPNGGDDLPF